MKINVVAALAGGLIIGAGAMVPLGSFAQSETPALSPNTSTEEAMVPTDVTAETPIATPEPTPAVPLTPPSFGPGDKTDDDDDDVEYEDDEDEDEDDEYEDEDDD